MGLEAIAVILFMAFAAFTPVSMILTSKMLRRRTRRNRVKDGAYESAEESSGTRISIMGEYIHYFPMFLAMEIIVTVVIVWSPVARSVSLIPSLAILGLPIVGMAFEAFMMLLSNRVGYNNG